MTNIDSILKSRDITLPTKVHLVKATVFPVVMKGCESSTIKKAEHQRTVASWDSYRFLRRQIRWSGIPISFRIFQFDVIHTVKRSSVVNKAEVDVFLELSCFFNDPMDVGNLISGSSAFSKTSLKIWKFMVHVLLKPGLENFEHYFTSM